MNLKKILSLITLSLLIIVNNNAISSDLERKAITNIDDNMSVNSEYRELLQHTQEIHNNSPVNQNDITLDVNNIQIQSENDDNFCYNFKTMTNGILLVPLAIYGGIVSNILINNNPQLSNCNNEMIRLRNQSKKLIGDAFCDTIQSSIKCIKIFGKSIVNIGINTYDGIKSYIVRNTWG